MRYRIAVLVGRLARLLLRLRGGGSAVPGRVALAIAPRFLEHAFGRLPHGLVFVSGSNGKSTTTNMLVAVLRGHGLEVFTNPSGGNLPQGIASALLADVPLSGRVSGDVAVLEVDEAYGVALAERLKPDATLLLNVQIDQLNRFHEPDRVAGMLQTIARRTGDLIVVNAQDPNLAALGAEFAAEGRRVSAFGADAALVAGAPHGLANAELFSDDERHPSVEPSVTVRRVAGRSATLATGEHETEVVLPARGLHYAVDAAGAVCLAAGLLGDGFDPERAARALESLPTVYGRGETLRVGGEEIEILMMKNPPSLQLNLDALPETPEQVLLSVDEGTPDPSWLYDIDLGVLDHVDFVSGTKAWQLATRLAYAGIPVGEVVVDPRQAVRRFLALPAPRRGLKTMILNYEQMMLIRKQLGFKEIEGERA